MGAEEDIAEGIEPEWWKAALSRGWLSAEQLLALYYSGRLDARRINGFPLFDVEPKEGLRILGVTTRQLVGAIVQREGNGTGVAISRWALSLSRVIGIELSWRSWINLDDLEAVNLQPTSGLQMTIHLRADLGDLGREARLPLDRSDYRGDSTPVIRRFAERLEGVLPQGLDRQ